jgi:hypothetical protein
VLVSELKIEISKCFIRRRVAPSKNNANTTAFLKCKEEFKFGGRASV